MGKLCDTIQLKSFNKGFTEYSKMWVLFSPSEQFDFKDYGEDNKSGSQKSSNDDKIVP